MRAETLARLIQIARGEPLPDVTGVTPVTPVTTDTRKPASLRLLRVLRPSQLETDAFEIAERSAIAIVDASIPTGYAEAWAAFQVRKPSHASAGDWYRAVDDAGRFLDAWAGLALDFGWRPPDIFGPRGLAWFCAGERIRALGPDNAITASGRIFTRPQIEGT